MSGISFKRALIWRIQLWAQRHNYWALNDIFLNTYHKRSIWRKIAYGYNWLFDRMPWTKPARFIISKSMSLVWESPKVYAKDVGRNVMRLTRDADTVSFTRAYLRGRHFCGWYKLTLNILERGDKKTNETRVLVSGFCYSKRKAYRILESLMANCHSLFPQSWIWQGNWSSLGVVKDIIAILDGKEPDLGIGDLSNEWSAAKRNVAKRLMVYAKEYAFFACDDFWKKQSIPYLAWAYQTGHYCLTVPEKATEYKREFRQELVAELKKISNIRPPYECNETKWFEA